MCSVFVKTLLKNNIDTIIISDKAQTQIDVALMLLNFINKL